jgi:hypothetical protein
MKLLFIYFFLFGISLGLTVLACHAIEWEQQRMYNLGVAEQRVRDYNIFQEQHRQIEVLKIELLNCKYK